MLYSCPAEIRKSYFRISKEQFVYIMRIAYVKTITKLYIRKTIPQNKILDLVYLILTTTGELLIHISIKKQMFSQYGPQWWAYRILNYFKNEHALSCKNIMYITAPLLWTFRTTFSPWSKKCTKRSFPKHQQSLTQRIKFIMEKEKYQSLTNKYLIML